MHKKSVQQHNFIAFHFVWKKKKEEENFKIKNKIETKLNPNQIIYSNKQKKIKLKNKKYFKTRAFN